MAWAIDVSDSEKAYAYSGQVNVSNDVNFAPKDTWKTYVLWAGAAVVLLAMLRRKRKG